SAVVAFDKGNGKELWRSLTAQEVCYSPPVVCEAGGKRQLVVWLDTTVNGLDPENGKPYWSHPYPADGKRHRPAAHIATPRQAGDLLLVSSFYNGSLMLKLAANKPGVTELWRGKSSNIEKSEGLHALMATPVIRDGHVYGVCGLGELRCLKADTGVRGLETYQATVGEHGPFGNAFLVPQGDRFFLFNDQGHLIIARLTPE